MRFPTTSLFASIRALALVWMSWAAFTSSSIESLIPALALGIGFEGLARLLFAPGTGLPLGSGQRLHACFGLAVAAAIVLRPAYSILTLSFILLLQVLIWLIGDGIFRSWALRATRAGWSDRSDDDARGPDVMDAVAIEGLRRRDRLAAAQEILAVAQIGFGLALHIWPGAGALDRGPVLGAAFLVLGVASALEAWAAAPDMRTASPGPPAKRGAQEP